MSPAELEAALLLHPNISDAAVIGVRLKQNEETELPRAYVVRKSNSEVSENDMKRFMATRIARYKNLDGGVVFVDTIRRNSTGKILKNILRDQAAAEIKDAQIENIKSPSSSATIPETTNGSAAPQKFSESSSVISYDADNENGPRSRRTSTSTAGTIHSDYSAQTSENTSPAKCSSDHLKHNAKSSTSTVTTDLEPGDIPIQDLSSHQATVERGQFPVGENEDLHSFHVQVPSSGLDCSPSISREAPANVSDEVASHDHVKKRNVDDTEDVDFKHKKLKDDADETLSQPTTEEASNEAIAAEAKRGEA